MQQRKIRFTRKAIECLPPCPADSPSREIEYTSLEAPPGLRLVVTKRGVKSWLLRYVVRVPGSPAAVKRAIKLGVFPGLEPAQACALALELRGKIARGIDPLAERAAADADAGLTLDAFFTRQYLPHARSTLRSAKDVESRWRLHVSPVFGQLRFAEVKPAAVLAFHDRKRAETCAATANRVLALLKRVINVAITLEVCERNPVRGIRMHQELNVRRRTLAGEELRRFVAALAEEPNRVAADFLLFALASAGRREECLQATFAEFDLTERLWHIPASRSKSGKGRTVPLNDVAAGILNRRAAQGSSPYVFPGQASKHLVSPTKAFARVLKRAGISDLKIHDLRRSAATLLINSGGSMTEARDLLGHSSATMTATRYAFLADARVREASQRVGTALSEAGAGG